MSHPTAASSFSTALSPRMRLRESRSPRSQKVSSLSASTIACAVPSSRRCPRLRCSLQIARRASKRRAEWRVRPPSRCCRCSAKHWRRRSDPQIRASLEQTRAGIAIKSADPALRLAAVKVLGESNQQRTKTLASAAPGEGLQRPVRRARREGARGGGTRHQDDRPPGRARRLRRAAFYRIEPREHIAAGRLGPGDHLRAARRDQYGARRDDHDRRLRDVCDAASRKEPFSRPARVVSGARRAGCICVGRPGRDGAWSAA